MGKFSTRDIIVTIIASGKSKILKDLHFKIESIRTLSSTPNICNLTIYNLSKNTRDFLTSIYDGDGKSKFTMKVELDNKEVFNGDIVNARSMYNVGTWETTIYCNEGFNAYQASATIKSKKGDTRADILSSMFDSLKQYGLNKVDIQAIKNGCGNKSLLKQILYDGNVVENIKKLLKDCLPNTDVYIESDKLSILPKNQSKPKTVTLDSFLEPPQLNEQGCRIKILFNPNPIIGGLINLKAKSYNQAFGNLSVYRPQKSRFSGEGSYKIIEIQHVIDNFSTSVAETNITGVII